MKTSFFVLVCFGFVAVAVVAKSEIKELNERFVVSANSTRRDVETISWLPDTSERRDVDTLSWLPDTSERRDVDTVIGTSSGCVYNSKVYQQGESWKVGCKYRCHCMDSLSGHYICNDLCLRLIIPPQCHLQPPMRGKCCPSPYCPEGFIIDYPPGYNIDE